jgi:hypothetical protein
MVRQLSTATIVNRIPQKEKGLIWIQQIRNVCRITSSDICRIVDAVNTDQSSPLYTPLNSF